MNLQIPKRKNTLKYYVSIIPHRIYLEIYKMAWIDKISLLLKQWYIYLFVCYELIEETGRYPKLILVYRGNFLHSSTSFGF